MSTAVTSFKQQCPGCGAQLTLKSTLAGKKVDCPKCKFRFVVELPGTDTGDNEEPKPAKGKEKDKAKAKGKEKGKGGKDAPKKKGEKSKMPLILAGVGILVLGIVGVLIFALSGSGSKPTPPAGNNQQQARNTGPGAAGGGGNANKDEGGGAPEDDAATDTLVQKLMNDGEKDNAKRQLMDMVLKGDDASRKRAFQALRKAAPFNDAAVLFLRDVVNEDKHPNATLLASEILKEHDTAAEKSGGNKALAGVKNDPTNLLPSDTQTVLFLDVRKTLDSDLQRAVFATGSYRKEDFQRRLGISIDNVDQIVIGGNRDHNRILGVIRTIGALNWDEVRHAMRIEGDGQTISTGKGSGTYYMGKVDLLTEYLGNRIKAITELRKKAAICKLNDWTLIFGDETAVREYLQNPPEINEELDKPKKSEKDRGPAGKGGSDAGSGPGAPGVGTGGSGAGSGPGAPGVGTGGSGAGSGPGAPGVGTGGSGAGSGPGMPGLGGSGSIGQVQGQGQGAGAEPEAPPVDKGRFLTLQGGLRHLIKMTEDGKDSLGMFADSSPKTNVSIVDWLLFVRDLDPSMKEKIRGYAIAVRKDDHLRMRAVLQCSQRSDSPPVFKKLNQILNAAAKGELNDLLGFKLTTDQDDPPPAAGNQAGAPSGGPGVGTGAGAGPGVGTGAGAGAGGGGGLPNKGGGAVGGGGLPNKGGGAGAGGAARREEPKDTKTESTMETDRRDEFITIDIVARGEIGAFVDERLAGYITSYYADMIMQGSNRLGDLAFGYTNFLHSNEKLPYGAFPRPSDAARGGRAWPPHERVSFLREFLPYLGDDRYFAIREGINASKSWRDAENIKQGRILIPQFLVPNGGPRSVKVASMDQQLAATHMVGMAGVGPDAAYLPKGHPQAGIFGYDRQLSLDELRSADGTSHTIMMIQTDWTLVGPWIAGGGYTVRGTSMSGNDVGQPGGFTSPAYNGQQGAWVIMGDGATRYLKKGINPNVFKALCTVWGRDDHGEIDLLAPRERLPVLQKAAPKPGEQKRPAKPGIVEEEDEAPKKADDKKSEEKKADDKKAPEKK